MMGPGEVTALAPQQIIRTDPAAEQPSVRVQLPRARRVRRAGAAVAVHARLGVGRTAAALAVPRRRRRRARRPARPTRRASQLPVLRIGPPATTRDRAPRPGRLVGVGACPGRARRHGAAPRSPPRSAATRPATCRGWSCGRLLAEQTDYLACVVPTFESGRRAGLGEDPAGAEGPAWKLAPGHGAGRAARVPPLALRHRPGRRLPVAGAGHPRPHGARRRSAHGRSTSRPPGSAWPAPTTPRSGSAARCERSSADPVAWSDPSLPARFAAALTEVLNTPDQAPAETPVLAPPRYGAAYRPVATLDPTAAGALVRAAQHRPGGTGRGRARRAGRAARPGDARGVGVGPGRRPARRRRARSVGRRRHRGGRSGCRRGTSRRWRARSACSWSPRCSRGCSLDPVRQRAGVDPVLAGDTLTPTFGADRPPRRPDAGCDRASCGRVAIAAATSPTPPSRRVSIWPCGSIGIAGPARARRRRRRAGDVRGARRGGDVADRPRVGADEPGHLHRCAAAAGVHGAPAVARAAAGGAVGQRRVPARRTSSIGPTWCDGRATLPGIGRAGRRRTGRAASAPALARRRDDDESGHPRAARAPGAARRTRRDRLARTAPSGRVPGARAAPSGRVPGRAPRPGSDPRADRHGRRCSTR